MDKRVVCFGDSNTWGYEFGTGDRYDRQTRWTGILQELLGKDYTVIEEGQNGRTFMNDDPWEGEKNGFRYIGPCIESQKPFDVLVLMLGTNDLKAKFSLTPYDIANGLGKMIEKIQSYAKYHMKNPIEILVISPAYINENIVTSCYGEMFGKLEAARKSKLLAEPFKEKAQEYGCHFLDAATVAKTNPVDAIHLDKAGHRGLAEKVAEMIQKMDL